MAFAKLKAALRRVAARTYDNLIEATKQALTEFEPSHCLGFFVMPDIRQIRPKTLETTPDNFWHPHLPPRPDAGPQGPASCFRGGKLSPT